MAASTNKFKLTKPELSEKVQVEVLNANMDLIDSALNDLQNQTTSNSNKVDSTTQSLQNHINDQNNPHSVTKGQIGLSNVENKSSAAIRGELTKDNVTNALGYTPYTPNEVDNKLSALETKIDWKEAVDTFNDIATTYPSPQDGWTVNVKDTDYTYRFDGDKWVVISANAIPKATHSVDGLLSKEDKANYDDANSKKHIHNNKSILDKITQSLLDNWNISYTHISDTIKHITSAERTNWTDAYDKRHTHNNKSILDGITSALISTWNNAAEHISDTVKHITTAERTLWNTVVNKVDKVDGKGLSANDYTTAEKEKLRDIAAGAEINVQSDFNVSDTSSDAYIKNKPTSMKNPAALTFTGGVTGSYDGSLAKSVAIPTSLPASNTTSDYSSTGTAPVNGTAVNKALQTLDVASKGGSGKYIQSISETDGKISAVEAAMPTIPAAVRVKGNAETAYRTGDVNITPANIGLGNVNNTADTNKDVSSAIRLRSRGNVTAETGVNLPAVSGLSMSQAYNNGYPTSYGNVLTLYGGGVSQLMLGWSGSEKGIVSLYYRNKRNVASNQWSDWREVAFTTSNVASATKAIQDGLGRVIADTYPTISDHNLKRKYEINLSSYANTNFYFVSFPHTDNEIDCEIHSPSLGGDAAYNQNILHFLLVAYGWSDTKRQLIILNHSVYSSSELTIMSIVSGQRNGTNGVYLRGGLKYRFFSNFEPTLRTSQYTDGDEIFPSGNTNCYKTGFTNVNILCDFTANKYKENYMLFDNKLIMNNAIMVDGAGANDDRYLLITKDGVRYCLPSGGFAGGLDYYKNGGLIGTIGFSGQTTADGYYYMGEAYNNPNGKLRVGALNVNNGNIIFADSGNAGRGIEGTMGKNDKWRLIGAATGDNAGYMEISTADDGTEPIYFRQYTGNFTTLKRTLTLLDANGNTTFPGNISVNGTVSSPNVDGLMKSFITYGGGDSKFNTFFAFLQWAHTYGRRNSGPTMFMCKVNESWCPLATAWIGGSIVFQDPMVSGATVGGTVLIWANNPSTNIRAADNKLYLGHFTTNNTETGTSVRWLTYSNAPFSFGKDSAGNYGYYKDGADTVTPFLSPLPKPNPQPTTTIAFSTISTRRISHNQVVASIGQTNALIILFSQSSIDENYNVNFMYTDNTGSSIRAESQGMIYKSTEPNKIWNYSKWNESFKAFYNNMIRLYDFKSIFVATTPSTINVYIAGVSYSKPDPISDDIMLHGPAVICDQTDTVVGNNPKVLFI